ncbi:MAG: DNA polymerase I, partial [Chloroflexi bacterium]
VGDPSDNIPGIKGIGEKTAVPLLVAYQTLDGIYHNIEAIKGATRKKLEEGREIAYISRELAQIKRDVPIQLDLNACVAHDFDVNAAIELFRELEFRSFINRLMQQTKPQQLDLFTMDSQPETLQPSDNLVDTIIVDDEQKLQALATVLNAAQAIVWDVETSGLDQMQVDLVGIALAVNGEQGYYIPLGHQKGKQLPLQKVMDVLRHPLTNPNIDKIAHNASFDLVVTSRYGIEVTPITFDTMIAEWLRDPDSKFLGLKNFAQQYLGVQMTQIEELIGSGKNQKSMAQMPIEQVSPYAAADAAITYRAAEWLRPKLEQENLLHLYNTLEMPLVPVLASMERAGVALDVAYLREMSQRLTSQLKEIEHQIYDLSGGYGEFNINSPKQLNEVLFEQLNLPVEGLKRTTHGYSTDVNTLEKLRNDTGHPIILKIIDYRELSKLQSTYVDSLPELVNPHTGRIHTSYNQTGTSTGRLSSNNPNLQNIPIRTEIGREVRRAFVAPPGKLLLSVDYSQVELRVMAHISQDKTLLEAFAQDQDIHAATAAAVFGVPLEEVTYEQRSFAKRVNFGLMYGMGAFRLARDSDLTLAEAEKFIQQYFKRLPNVERYIRETKEKARKQGYLETLFGRKRRFNALYNAAHGGRVSQQIVAAEERAAINMPIQGTAADIMKRAMIDVYAALKDKPAFMILQVHDELVLEVPEDALQMTRDLVVQIMEQAFQLDAPLKANAQAGSNWRDMQPL